MSQTTGLKRTNLDKFYTNENVVKTCINCIKEHSFISRSDLIIEPSAGNGAFIDSIKSFGCEYTFYDIEPRHPEVILQDYTSLKVEHNGTGKIHIIGNPPFGRQSSLALKFIKKSCEFCETFSFVLPRSFKKDSFKNKVPECFHLLREIDLPKDSFLVDGKVYDVPCVFQIYVKRGFPRPKPVKLTPKSFDFVNKTDAPDVSFRRVGINAGAVSEDIADKSTQSHYFIKFKPGVDNQKMISKMKSLVFECNTVGPRSISKQELIKELVDFV